VSEYCDTVTFRGSVEEPPEYCENEPIEGTDKCPRHTDDRDWDAIRDSAIEQRLEDTK
jgi:hypothetical protein